MEKKTLGEILDDFAHPEKAEIKNCSVNGKCSKCGECCSNILPVCQEELYTIANYVIEHKIRPQKHLLVMQNKLMCPYFNGSKCLIYEVRPLICREFYCYKKPDIETCLKFKGEYVTIDMWKFAEDIDMGGRK